MAPIPVPTFSLVLLIGPSGSGKTTFAQKHFRPTEILNSDHCRALIADDENDQSATRDAFALLHFIAAKRLTRRMLVVIDATNIHPHARQPLLQLARKHHCLARAIVFNLSEDVCLARHRARKDRLFGGHVITRQIAELRSALGGLRREGFDGVTILESVAQVNEAKVERVPLPSHRLEEHGPFDIIGDLHGCCDELEELLARLGYAVVDAGEGGPLGSPVYGHAEGRKAVFLGDLVDRGPRILDTFRLVRAMVLAERALCVPGNHDIKFMRWLRGAHVRIHHGLEGTVAEVEALPPQARRLFAAEAMAFIEGLAEHLILDGGKLVVAHGGMKKWLQGRSSPKVRQFALYGETKGEMDELGLPIRYNWAKEYRGQARVVYGHTPVPRAEWLHRTINIDTGCVFGGKLTALRYPELEIHSVPAASPYSTPVRPFLPWEEDPSSRDEG